MRKQLDTRIPALIRNGVAQNHRSFFVLVGDNGRDQVVNLHFLLAQSRTQARPSVLWCYRKELGFTTHRKKREAKVKRDIKRGIRDKDDALSPFELFVGVTDIRYCYYKDTQKVLGRTFGMLVLQDFEAITPNLLARTIETVEGGGVVVLMLKTMASLRQLYGAAMDVHARYRSSFSQDEEPVARFNERFLLSLAASPACLVLDDELNVLPVSRGRDIKPLQDAKASAAAVEAKELRELKDDLRADEVVGPLVDKCRTMDQAKGVLTILDVLASSSLSTTVALTAARGRGKSAALGLCIAAAVAHGYANIFVTSPSPENLRTLFEFVVRGLEALGYDEVADWDLQRGVGEWKELVVRVNVFRRQRQTIQYITPNDAQVLGQAELVVIDEAAAIPLPLVRSLMGPYLVFLSSTINGYEGTGRSLSLKLIQQLRESARGTGGEVARLAARKDDEDAMLVRSADVIAASAAASTSASAGPRPTDAKAIGTAPRGAAAAAALSTRSLKEVQLSEPIRYSSGDPIESWLHELLCLDASLAPLSSTSSAPHPSRCELFLVDRDALFSYHAASEAFLQRLMALYVASHYKNSPNDLQLMSDAPAHRLFVLLAPPSSSSQDGGGGGREGGGDDPAGPSSAKATLPEPLCVIQVALEGNISRASILNSLARGQRTAGDLIPWLVSQQYQDPDFASLSGARVVRIAVHPHHARVGYGSRALELLRRFYAGELLDADALAVREAARRRSADAAASKAPGAATQTFASVRDEAMRSAPRRAASSSSAAATLLEDDELKPRDASRMPALLRRLSEVRAEALDWMGVSYGLTPSLFRFWRRAGYVPLHVSQLANELTGEYSTLQLRGIDAGAGGGGGGGPARPPAWLGEYAFDFRRRLVSLLGFGFRELPCVTALSVLESVCAGARRRRRRRAPAHNNVAGGGGGGCGGDEDVAEASADNPSTPNIVTAPLSLEELRTMLSAFDVKRLEAYGAGTLELHAVLDLLPWLAQLYFGDRLEDAPAHSDATAAADDGADDVDGSSASRPRLVLSGVQSAMLLGVGLQRKDVSVVQRELSLPFAQAMALFAKAIRRCTSSVRAVERRWAAESLRRRREQQQGRKDGPLASTASTATSARAQLGGEAETLERELRRAGRDDVAENERLRRLREERDRGRGGVLLEPGLEEADEDGGEGGTDEEAEAEAEAENGEEPSDGEDVDDDDQNEDHEDEGEDEDEDRKDAPRLEADELRRFAISDRSEAEWAEAERRIRTAAQGEGGSRLSTTFSVKGAPSDADSAGAAKRKQGRGASGTAGGKRRGSSARSGGGGGRSTANKKPRRG